MYVERCLHSMASLDKHKVGHSILPGVVEAGLDSEEFGLVCKCEGDYIDLLLDTGTVSNLVPEGQREVVHIIHEYFRKSLVPPVSGLLVAVHNFVQLD